MDLPSIILASGSPRRATLLDSLGIDFEIMPSEVEEIVPQDMPFKDVAIYLAQLKSNYISKHLVTGQIILAADTIVVHDDTLLGKPENRDMAVDYLHRLSADCHQVITGVHLLKGTLEQSFSVCSQVFVEELSDEEIDYYLDNYEYMDKAGAYGIQDWFGMSKIARIEGSYTNIMGLPTAEVYEALRHFGVDHN